MTIGLEAAFEFADLAPALKVVVGIDAIIAGDHLGEAATKQGKCPFGVDNADSHIVLVKDKHVTIQTGLKLCR